MTEFAKRAIRRQDDFIVRSLLDIDFYKLTMGFFIWKYYPDTEVTFELINRNTSMPLAKVIPEDELRRQLDHVKSLSLTATDTYYLRGMDVYGNRMFDEDWLLFLRNLQMTDYTLERIDDQYKLSFTGPWSTVTYWETIALAVISELYYRVLMQKMKPLDIKILYARATDKIYGKLKKLSKLDGLLLADFGQRRRHSFLWQQEVISMAGEVLGDKFTGTSNTWMAFNMDMVPIGTNAHELPMVLSALAESDTDLKNAQYSFLHNWRETYGEGLRVVLPDTYGSQQFFDDMPESLAREIATEWRGMRQDSGDPWKECDSFMQWLQQHGENPMDHVCIFSDGLDTDLITRLHSHYKGQIVTPFGWGTNLTNDFRNCHPNAEEIVPGFIDKTWDDLFRPFSIVCKVTHANNKPAVKLSNNPLKATGPAELVDHYLDVFGRLGKTEMAVTV